MIATALWILGGFALVFVGYYAGVHNERELQARMRVEREEAIRKLWNGQIARWNEANAERRRDHGPRKPYSNGVA